MFRTSVRPALGRRLTILLLSLAILASTASAAATRAEAAPARVAPQNLKVMNYYPMNTPWAKMWRNYDHATIDADFGTIASLGANAVRVYVQTTVFGFPQVDPGYAAKLADVVATARAHKLSVQLTLFDWFTDYTDIEGSKTWAAQLLRPYVNNRTVALIELHNEVPLGDPAVQTWVKTMMPVVKSIAPAIPLTVSVGGAQDTGTMATLDSLTGSSMDVVDVHLYGPVTSVVRDLTGATSIARGRPVFAGEAGWSSFGATGACADARQVRYYQNMIALAARFGVSSIAPWTLNDFPDSAVDGVNVGKEQYFGLRRTDGSWKPAAQVIRTLFRGTGPAAITRAAAQADVTRLDIDNKFACGVSTAEADPLAQWNVYNSGMIGASGVSKLSNGSTAAYLANTGGQSWGWPSLMQQFPVSKPSVTVTVDTQLVLGTGTTIVSIAWFRGGQYLGQTNSNVAQNPIVKWQRLTATGTPMAGADNYQVHLKSAFNTGTAYFRNVVVR